MTCHWMSGKPKGLVGTPLSEREERLFTNRSNRPGDDMKDELRTDGDPIAWRIWSTAQNQLWQLRQPAPPLEFPGEQGMFTDMYAQVREEEQVISLQFTCSQQDVSKRRRKKRKQVDDGTAIVQLHTALAFDYFLLKTLWEPGIVVCRESLSLFHLVSPFTRLVRDALFFLVLCFWVLFWGFVWFGLLWFPLSLTFPFWSRCLTMTILAQLNDCHSCNDARSIVQKKMGSWRFPTIRPTKKSSGTMREIPAAAPRNIVQDPSLLEVQKSPKKKSRWQYKSINLSIKMQSNKNKNN